MKDYDVFYRKVRFNSFVELARIHRETDKYKVSITLRYNGTDLCGDVEINVSAGHSDIRDEFLELAAKTLRIF